MIKDENYLFSFAGLKTSALYWLRDNPPLVIPTMKEESLSNFPTHPHPAQAGNTDRDPSSLRLARDDKQRVTINDFCASFEQAIVDVLVAKTIKATIEYKPKTIILAGGVSANKKLRLTLEENIKKLLPTPHLLLPSLKYCMDNGAMIAAAGYYHALKKDFTAWKKIQADPNWELAI